MKLEKFEKSSLEELRKEINPKLKEIGEKFGISLRLGRISYDAYSFTGKIEAKILISREETEKIERGEFESLAVFYGLKKEDYGRTFSQNGKIFKIVAIKTRNRKYPIIARNGERTYKFDIRSVQLSLGR